MKINETGLALIKSFEGLRLKAYKPVPSEKYYTIGYGHYGPDVKKGMVITEEQAEELLRQDLERFENGVLDLLTISELTSNQFSALVSLAYNVGIGNFKKSTLLKLINSGHKDDLELIHKQFSRWVYANNKVLPGLVKRREAEFDLYSTPDPSDSMTEGNIEDEGPEYHCNLK